MKPVESFSHELSLYPIQSKRLTDVEEQADSLSGWRQEYQQLSVGNYVGAVSSISFPEVELLFESSNRELYQQGDAPKDSVVLAFAQKAGGEGWISGKKFDNNTMLVLANGNELDFRTPPDLIAAALTVDSKVFAHYLHMFDASNSFDIAVKNRFAEIPQSVCSTLRDYIGSVIPDIQRGDIDLSHPAAALAFKESLINNFILALTSLNPAGQALPRSAQQRHRIVGKAVEYMRSKLDHSISIVDVCTAIFVEQRVLNYCFQEVLGISPISYLKCLRMNQVRRELKNMDCSLCNIGDIATRWGFWHLGRFSVEYKKRFGESPSDTVRLFNSKRLSVAPAFKFKGANDPSFRVLACG